MDLKITTEFYAKYINQYVKRFYASFEAESVFKIIGFKLTKKDSRKTPEAHFNVLDETTGNTWWWDVDDCVIITNEDSIQEDNRIANTNHSEYKGYNPFTRKYQNKLNTFA